MDDPVSLDKFIVNQAQYSCVMEQTLYARVVR